MGFVAFASSSVITSNGQPPILRSHKNASGDSQGVKPNLKAVSQSDILVTYIDRDYAYPLPSSSNLKWRNVNVRSRGIMSRPLFSKQSGSPEEDHRALETVLRLYSALKRRDTKELSDVIGDECRCISNFVLDFKPVYGKQEVLEFFTSLIRTLGGNVEFIVQPVLEDGMNVGVAWTLECNKTHTPLGKGFSFYICHTYHGRVMIRNVEILMEPLFHIEPLRLILSRYVVEAVSSTKLFKGVLATKRARYMLLSFLLMAASLYFLKHSF